MRLGGEVTTTLNQTDGDRSEQEGEKTDDRDSVAQGDADEVGDSEEEDIFVEEEMVLRVGHGGRIGTLHVR